MLRFASKQIDEVARIVSGPKKSKGFSRESLMSLQLATTHEDSDF
jgi:hypothetical protein